MAKKIRKRFIYMEKLAAILISRNIQFDQNDILDILQKSEKAAGLTAPTKGMPFSTIKGRLSRVYHYLTGNEQLPTKPEEIEESKPKKPDKVITDSAKLNRFYQSYDWRQIRYIAIKKSKGRCMACNRADLPLHVDHIQSLRKHWSRRLDITNLQVLCEECNHGKGNWDETDWRDKEGSNLVDDLREYFDQWPFWQDLEPDLQKELVTEVVRLAVI